MNIGTNRNLQSCTKSKEIYPTSEQSDVSPTISYLKSQLYQLFNIPRWRAFHHTLSSQTSLTRRLRKPFPHCQCAPRLQTRSQIFNTGTQKHCLQKGSLSTILVPGIFTRHVFTWNGSLINRDPQQRTVYKERALSHFIGGITVQIHNYFKGLEQMSSKITYHSEVFKSTEINMHPENFDTAK